MAIHSLRRWGQFWSAPRMALVACVALALSQWPARGDDLVKHPTFYRTTKVDGLSIFYREAGPSDAPTLLLLHGFPSSSRMFEPLFARLSDRYHLIAPDYPGFGHSDWPNPKAFNYTFDHIASVMDDFTQSIGLSHYTLYMQDYGGPVGFRMALAHPERVEALIVQDAVAHNEGLGELWKPRRAFWADRAAHESAFRANFLSLATTRARHAGDDPNPEPYDPDLWTDELAFLKPAGASGHSNRTLLRLSNKRRRLSQMAGLDAKNAAAFARYLGQAWLILRFKRARTLSEGRPRRSNSRSRRQPFRA